MGSDRHAQQDVAPISQDDYFKLNAPFRLWLRKEKDRYFDELKTDKARKYFASFVRHWNDGTLRSRYYKTDSELTHLSADVVTRHKWGFGDKEPHRETMQGPTLPRKDEVPRDSAKRFRDEQGEREHHRRKRYRKEAKERTEMVLDEVAPRETGREARILKKRALNSKLHGEKSTDVTLDDADIYGDTKAEFTRLVRSRESRKADRHSKSSLDRQAAANELREKEKQTIE
ncbi:hypothetical protein FBU59_005602, partial [Linderina macrospora]